MKRSSARLADIAKETGFSVNTVSLALRGSSRISEETRALIQQAADRLSYVPNGLARSLVQKKSNTIGIIFRDLSNPLFISAAKTIEKMLAKQGYMLIILSAKEDGVAEINALISQQVQGILIYPVWTERAVSCFERLRKENFPLVLMNFNGKPNNLDMVYVDRQIGGYIATEHLIKLGHTQIAAIADDGLKLAGYRQALDHYHCAADSRLIYCTSVRDYQCGYDAAEHLFTHYAGLFSAVFATTDRSAIGFMRYCQEHCIRIPQDVSLIGYDNNDVSAFVDVPLTTVSYHVAEEAAQAVNLLLQRIGEEFYNKPPIQIQIRPELIVRRSCGQHLKNIR